MTGTVVNTIMGPFDEKRYDALKKVYLKAVEEKVESFLFEGTVYSMEFTEYLIEFLDPTFKDMK